MAATWLTGQAAPQPSRPLAAQPSTSASSLHVDGLDVATLHVGGLALPAAQAEPLARHFGRSLTALRVHEGPAAQSLARQFDAEAFTYGTHIWFGSGRSAHEPGLLAHEATHALQQQAVPAAGLRVQRLRKGDGALRIVEIVAFEHSLKNAQARLSDGDVQPIRLQQNELSAGVFQFHPDASVQTGYRGSDGPVHGTFTWVPGSAISGARAPKAPVTVRILAGDPQTLQERRVRLHEQLGEEGLPNYARFLRRHDGGSGTYADEAGLLQAEEVLALAGVTEDEMLQVSSERQAQEAQGRTTQPGMPGHSAQSPQDWALSFVSERNARLGLEQQEAADSRSRLQAQLPGIERLAAVNHQLAQLMQALPAGNHGYFFASLAEHYARQSADMEPFFAAFEGELRRTMQGLIAQTETLLLRIEDRYLAGENVGAESRRLAAAIHPLQDARAARDAAGERLQEVTAKKAQAMLADTAPPSSEDVSARIEESKQAEADYQAKLGRSPLALTERRGHELEADGDSLGSSSLWRLRATVHDMRENLPRARAMLRGGDTASLYRADRVLALTKQRAGIVPGSTADALIDFHASVVTAEPLWQDILNLVSLLAALVPGVGPGLQFVLSVTNTAVAAGDFHEQLLLHDAGFSNVRPSKFAVIMNAAGGMADLGSAIGIAAKAGKEMDALTGLLYQSKTAGSQAAAAARGMDATADEGASAANAASAIDHDAAATSQGARGADTDMRGEAVGEGHRIREAEPEAALPPAATAVAAAEPAAPLLSRGELLARRAEIKAAQTALRETQAGLKSDLATRRSSISLGHRNLKALKSGSSLPVERVRQQTEKLSESLERVSKREAAEQARMTDVEEKLAALRQEAEEVEASLQRMPLSLGKLQIEPKPVRLRTAGGAFLSWSREFLLGTNLTTYRSEVEAILQSDPQGPLSRILLNARGEMHAANLPAGSRIADFANKPFVWHGAHVVTRGHDTEVLVVSTLYRNERLGADLERTGAVATEFAYVIQGIAVDAASARAMVFPGGLTQAELDAAPLVRLID